MPYCIKSAGRLGGFSGGSGQRLVSSPALDKKHHGFFDQVNAEDHQGHQGCPFNKGLGLQLGIIQGQRLVLEVDQERDSGEW